MLLEAETNKYCPGGYDIGAISNLITWVLNFFLSVFRLFCFSGKSSLLSLRVQSSPWGAGSRSEPRSCLTVDQRTNYATPYLRCAAPVELRCTLRARLYPYELRCPFWTKLSPTELQCTLNELGCTLKIYNMSPAPCPANCVFAVPLAKWAVTVFAER